MEPVNKVLSLRVECEIVELTHVLKTMIAVHGTCQQSPQPSCWPTSSEECFQRDAAASETRLEQTTATSTDTETSTNTHTDGRMVWPQW